MNGKKHYKRLMLNSSSHSDSWVAKDTKCDNGIYGIEFQLTHFYCFAFASFNASVLVFFLVDAIVIWIAYTYSICITWRNRAANTLTMRTLFIANKRLKNWSLFGFACDEMALLFTGISLNDFFSFILSVTFFSSAESYYCCTVRFTLYIWRRWYWTYSVSYCFLSSWVLLLYLACAWAIMILIEATHQSKFELIEVCALLIDGVRYLFDVECSRLRK